MTSADELKTRAARLRAEADWISEPIVSEFAEIVATIYEQMADTGTSDLVAGEIRSAALMDVACAFGRASSTN